MFMSFLFVSGSVFKAEGEEEPGKPLDKPVPDHSWFFPEYFFTPSAQTFPRNVSRRESPHWMCPLGLLISYSYDVYLTYSQVLA